MRRSIIDARLEIYFATAMRAKAYLSLIRCFASSLRTAGLDGEDEGKRKEKERSSFRNHRFFCLLAAMHRTAAAGSFVVLWRVYRCARATARIAHAVFFLSPHTRTACT